MQVFDGTGEGVGPNEEGGTATCHGCLADLSPSGCGVVSGAGGEAGVVLRCPDCKHLFCFDCDAYVHEQLHNCPGCEALPGHQATDDSMDVG